MGEDGGPAEGGAGRRRVRESRLSGVLGDGAPVELDAGRPAAAVEFDRDNVEDLFEFCKKKDVGVICMKPMSGHFVPNWAKDVSNPKVARLLDELKEFGPMVMRHVELKIVFPTFVGDENAGELNEYIVDTYIPMLMTEEQFEYQGKAAELEE